MQLRADPTLPRLSRLLLDPLSILFKTASFAVWKAKSLRQRSFPGLFIITADGLSFGGSGKTPLVMAVGKALEARSARFAVVSRGYRSQHEKTGILVKSTHTCKEVGDESLMLKASFPRQDVFIGRDRVRSITAAADRGARFIILDDGFQSSHIRKDFSIMLVNPAHPYYYLRHFRFLSRRDDCLLVYRSASPGAQPKPGTYHIAVIGFIDTNGRETKIGGDSFIAFSALGDNERFAVDMRSYRLAAFRPFADHHAYTAGDLRSLEALRKEKKAAWMVCTEKDFFKLKELIDPGPLAGDRIGARRGGLQGLPLLYARNEIQLPKDLFERIFTHAEEKGVI